MLTAFGNAERWGESGANGLPNTKSKALESVMNNHCIPVYNQRSFWPSWSDGKRNKRSLH